MKRKPDPFRVIVILAAGAAIVWMLLLIGKSDIGWMLP